MTSYKGNIEIQVVYFCTFIAIVDKPSACSPGNFEGFEIEPESDFNSLAIRQLAINDRCSH